VTAPKPSPLAGVHIFAGLSSEMVAALAQAARPLEATRGGCVVSEGTTGGCLYLILEGRVEIVKGVGTGKETVLAQLGPREFFGEMGLIEPNTRSASVRVLEDASFLSLDRAAILHVFRQDPREYGILVTNIARDLSRRLRRMDEVFAAVSF
jgi:CRP-like cAMP-binding protein